MGSPPPQGPSLGSGLFCPGPSSLRTLRTITELRSAVVRRSDGCWGIPVLGERRVGRSYDRRGRDSAAMGSGRLSARRAGAATVCGGGGADCWLGRSRGCIETGLARSTINRGEDYIDAKPLPKRRVRCAGGGRRAVCENDPGLVPALERLVAPATLGDPMRPLIWVSKSMEKLAATLTRWGIRSAPTPCARSW